jgi:hypothetical protein
MSKKLELSTKWGPHWPTIGEAQLSPILEQFGFFHSSTFIEDGIVYWKRVLSDTFQLRISVNPNTSPLPNHCRFSGGLHVESEVMASTLIDAGCTGQTQSLGTISFLSLSWLVRRQCESRQRFFWDIDIGNPDSFAQIFHDDFENCIEPFISKLRTENDLLDFIRNLDEFSKVLRGGPAYAPRHSLKLSILHFLRGDQVLALSLLDEYERLEAPSIQRFWRSPNDKSKLDIALLSLNEEVSRLRNYYDSHK